MPCDQWGTLLERYRSAVSKYDESVRGLSLVPGAAFNETWQRAEQARKHSGDCRADLLHHEHDHACLTEAGQPETNNEMSDVDQEEFILGDQVQSVG
jgi:hypothetical protein